MRPQWLLVSQRGSVDCAVSLLMAGLGYLSATLGASLALSCLGLRPPLA